MGDNMVAGAGSADISSIGRLRGRRVVITGAASGIGRSTAQLFALQGASLTLLDRHAEGVSQVARETGAHGFAVDITDEPAVADAVERGAEAMGGIDGIVNAAGIMFRGAVSDVPAASWRNVLEVNLTGSYIVIRSCMARMTREEAGSIVNIASAAGLLPNAPNYTAYSASKGGVIALTRALAAELAPKVRVNAICPGMVDTPMADGVRGNVSNYALRRLAAPLEIAQAILFLTAPESSYVTGSALAVDGGRSFH
jgi:NAD(P)-dependent dehydrogenase (short-subunit alcohol dehydrogenase family)